MPKVTPAFSSVRQDLPVLHVLPTIICYIITFIMNTPASQRFVSNPAHDVLAHAADRIGATASFLCALHCAALPFVIAILPAFGLSFLADHRFERIFIACASVLALGALIRGYRRHHDAIALYVAGVGLTLLWVGAWLFDADRSLGLHATLVTLGGCTVALAHVLNLRLTHQHGACCSTPA